MENQKPQFEKNDRLDLKKIDAKLNEANKDLYTLFVCAANVWRSQVAEWVAKYFWINAISCASVEARKDKYNWKPDEEITQLLLKKYWIDISDQKILYPSDIKSEILAIERVVFMFDPKNIDQIDEEVLIDNMPLWTFLDMIGKKYEIKEVVDPYNLSKSTKEKIIENIYKIIEE